MITANLYDPQSDKTCRITLDGKKIITNNSGKGRSRITEKEYLSEEEAAKFFEKNAWAILKKGFVQRSDENKKGLPTLHYFTSMGYTGCLSFEGTPEGIFVYKHGWFNSAKDQQDFLICINADGELKETIELPKVLPWEICYNSNSNSLLMDIDHYIYNYDLIKKEFIPLTTKINRPASFITISENNIAYGAHPLYKVEDNKGRIILDKEFNVKIIQGSIPFCAVLSKKGNLLAFHNKEKEIQLINTQTGECIGLISGNFEMITQMQFVADDALLIIREQYGSWTTRFFEIETGKVIEYPGLKIPEYSKEVDCFCFNADESILVQTQRTNAYVFDFKAKKYLYNFHLEHCVKRAEIKFIDDKVGVRTDYGCFSLYAI